ncbi:unnamed protein product [Calicophoron daubneyi]|uniref:Uncharacterized protein n=1 Tax=Calicophoron daubneyi TaxID=300641 RepID=A0AAV2THP9_CALDB
MSGGGLNTLSERLRKNWMQKLSLDEVPDDSLTNLTWLYDMHPIGLEVESTQRGLDFEFKSGVDYSGKGISLSHFTFHSFRTYTDLREELFATLCWKSFRPTGATRLPNKADWQTSVFICHTDMFGNARTWKAQSDFVGHIWMDYE